MKIEYATIHDAREILELQKLAYQSEAAIYNDYAIPPLTQSLEAIQAEFDTHIFLKTEADDKIIGSVRGYLQGDACFIGRLIVHPDYQNRGIGSCLMEAIEAHFEEAQRFELFTGEKSERNCYFYQKLGYTVFRSSRLTDRVSLLFLEKRRRP